jgi:lysophospholipase
MQQAPFLQLPDDTLAPASAFFVQADDGKRLRLAFWETDNNTPRGSILLFPGRTEYVEKYSPIARRLTDEGYHVLGIDWRGQGLSDRLQDDPLPGHVDKFSDYQRDVHELVAAAILKALPKPWHLLAHSMGGCIGLAALENGLPVQSAVFSAPMWGINLRKIHHGPALGISYIAERIGRGGLAVPGSGGTFSTYALEEGFKENLLTSNVDEWSRLTREAGHWPELTIGGASFHWAGEALTECTRLSRIPSPKLPVLVSLGSEEKIVATQAIHDRVAKWPNARLIAIEGAKHEVMLETPVRRDQFFAAMLAHFEAS